MQASTACARVQECSSDEARLPDPRPCLMRSQGMGRVHVDAGMRWFAVGVTTGLVAAVLAVSASGANTACNYGASPPAALRPLLRQGGFTYGFLHCTRFGIA